MHNLHVKNTVRYYVVLVIFLAFFFFSNGFGLIDVQKTAIVIAAGIDREDDTFILTSQIAIPQASKQGKNTEAVQIVSRGKTVSDAFEEINAKTGWYPKLVFCNLIILGEKAAKENVFEALDFFLRDEYLTDNCLVATCDGYAKDLLNTTALVDSSSSLAMQKVLSAHAERVGTVLPSTLREFSVGYFSESKSGHLPILKKEPQQEEVGEQSQSGGQNQGGQTGQAQGGAGGGQNAQSSGQTEKKEDKPVFSAGETALFVGGKRVGRLSAEETFALSTVLSKLRLASYSIERENTACTFTVKQNGTKLKLKASENENFTLKIDLTLTAGIADISKPQSIDKISDAGDVPKEFFAVAEKKLAGEIQTVFEKCKAVGCDLFGVRERLVKYENHRYRDLQAFALEHTRAEISVRFRGIR